MKNLLYQTEKNIDNENLRKQNLSKANVNKHIKHLMKEKKIKKK